MNGEGQGHGVETPVKGDPPSIKCRQNVSVFVDVGSSVETKYDCGGIYLHAFPCLQRRARQDFKVMSEGCPLSC